MSSNFNKKCEFLTKSYQKNTNFLKEDGENDPGNQAAIGLAKGAFTIGKNMFKYFFTLKKFILEAVREVRSINNEFATLYSGISGSHASRAAQMNRIPLERRAVLQERVQTLSEKIEEWQKTLSQLIQTKKVRASQAKLKIISDNLKAAESGSLLHRPTRSSSPAP